MQKSTGIVRYAADEIDEMRRHGESQTDWARVDAMTEEELEASIDHEEEGEFDLSRAQTGLPGFEPPLTIRLDPDVLAWFKAQGDGYRGKINAVLRAYVAAQKR